MVSRYVSEMENALSPERLSSYRQSRINDLESISTYFWNIALCQALYPCLGTLEVALRNSIHRTLSDHFGRDDWYNAIGLLLPREQRDVVEAKRRIQLSNKPATPGRIVADLHFGFWTSLLSSIYGNSPKGPQLWVSPGSVLLAAAFPNAPMSHQPYRARIHSRIDTLRHLRNRVFHYEPVWAGVRLPSGQRGNVGQIVPLAILHADLTETLGWINTTLHTTLMHIDTFDKIYSSGRAEIETQLESYVAAR